MKVDDNMKSLVTNWNRLYDKATNHNLKRAENRCKS